MRQLIYAVTIICAFLVHSSAAAQNLTVTIDSSAAHAVVEAIGNPSLSLEEARQIAQLPGNQALLRKAATYDMTSTVEDFANALVAAAHGTPLSEDAFGFDRVASVRDQIQEELRRIDQEPAFYNDWVFERIGKFTPNDLKAELKGYIIAGGPSLGFAFGEGEFFVDQSRLVGEPAVGRAIMAHELFHSIQSTITDQYDTKPLLYDDDSHELYLALPAKEQQCAMLDAVASVTLTEGSASYVSDVMSLDENDGTMTKFQRDRFVRGLSRTAWHAKMLDFILAGTAETPTLTFDDAYTLAFARDEHFYHFGYALTEALVKERGNMIIAELLAMPPRQFFSAYRELDAYGKDVPAFGPVTEARLDECL